MPLLFCLIKALVIGIAIAAPVGPIGMICIRKTLERGLRGALAVGLGAAVADSVYGIVAITGLTAITQFLLEKALLIKLFGGVFLLYLAYKEIKSTPTISYDGFDKNKKLGRLALQVFFLTLTNPMTILSFVGIFASIGGGVSSPIESYAMIIGIFLGSMSWWLTLGFIISKIQNKLPEVWIGRIRYLSTLILAGFGLLSLVSSLLLLFL